MTPFIFSFGVATLAAVLKIVFIFAIRADERLRREERARLKAENSTPPSAQAEENPHQNKREKVS